MGSAHSCASLPGLHSGELEGHSVTPRSLPCMSESAPWQRNPQQPWHEDLERAPGAPRAPHCCVFHQLARSLITSNNPEGGTLILFIDEKTGAQRGLETCPKCPSGER